MSRLTLSDSDKHVRDWFISTTESLGCKTTVDQMGNIFAVKPGKNSSLPPTVCGSHLDTQPTGGRYDGILGVLSGVEMLRVLAENNYETEAPIGVVNWTNEEGARFPKSVLSSSVWAGLLSLEEAWGLKELPDYTSTTPKTVREELERIGYLGTVPASYKTNPLAAHFELHIEQGPILEAEKKKVGIVQGGQGYNWLSVTVSGRAAHTGSTPFANRSDPMLAAARMIAASNVVAKKFGGLASTGVLHLQPGSTNTIPSEVKFMLDLRHREDEKLAKMEAHCRDVFTRIAEQDSERGCTVSITVDTAYPVVKFDRTCIGFVEQSAESVVGKDGYLEIVSGAGHDSCSVTTRCPTTMIFVPCKEGVSHHPEEFCSKEDCAIGAQVLMESVLRFDKARKDLN
jgi:hydantoinase/carbamoylase family amidase